MLLLLLAICSFPVETPQYKFEPGLELNYQATYQIPADEKNKQQAREHHTAWQIYVLKKNPDGSYQVVLLSQMGTEPNIQHESRRVELFPDGRVKQESEPLNSFMPLLLPPLARPEDKEWKLMLPRDSVTSRFTVLPSTGDKYLFREERTGGILTIYDAMGTFDYTFDPAQGCITSITGKRKPCDDPDHVPYQHSSSTNATYTVLLKKRHVHPADRLQQIIRESDLYFTLKDDNLKNYVSARQKPVEEAKKMMEAMAARWEKAKADFTIPGYVGQVENGIKNGKNYVRWVTQDAQRWSELIGKPVPAWEARDFEGQTYSSESLKGKVVILDFWYRGCLWCLRAMPQVNELASDFKNQPVVILGVNIDENPEDARLVIRRFKLNYPNLDFNKVMKQSEKHHPLLTCTFGYPTLLVIDPQGKLVDIHAGYSATLREEVTASIKRALGK